MLEIYAKIIAHSRAPNGQTIVTWELQYPRLILAELNTHRQLSKNSSSSRAIPIQTIIDMVKSDPAMPVRFGANQAGMQDKGVEHDALIYHDALCPFDIETGRLEGITAREAWRVSACKAADVAEAYAKAGYHKQVGNRVLEPYQWMKTVLTGTCPDNFFWLRRHTDADPTIHALAECMWQSLQASTPVDLKQGWWHTPYYDNGFWTPWHLDEDVTDYPATLEEALAISSSCCAQVSYRKLDDSLEKAELVYERLVGSEPVHASPFEHQATPMWPNRLDMPETWEEGITHVDREGNFWSGNFVHWIQHRQLIPNNVCNNYKEPQ